MEQRTGNKAANDGPDDPQEDRAEDSLAPADDHVCDESGDRPKDDPRDDAHSFIPPDPPAVIRLEIRLARASLLPPVAVCPGPCVRVTDRLTGPASNAWPRKLQACRPGIS